MTRLWRGRGGNLFSTLTKHEQAFQRVVELALLAFMLEYAIGECKVQYLGIA